MNIIVYKTNGCGYCVKIDELMERANLEYNSILVGRDITKEEFLNLCPEAKGYPHVIIDGQRIGGLVETVKYLLEKGLISSRKNE